MVPTLTEEFYLKRINVDISSHCMLKCPRCIRQKPGYEKGSDITVKNFDKICKAFKNIAMMGSASDCIYHHDFISILDVCVKNGNSVNIHTNGHGKSDKWWDKVIDKCKELNDVKFVFALDGLPEESEMYRIGQDGEAVWKIMKKVRNRGFKVVWQYIVFSYNEDHIEEAKQMALDNDIDFTVLLSSRWDGVNDIYKPSKYFLERPVRIEDKGLIPSCKLPNGYNPVYLSTGYFMPCCDIKYSDKTMSLYSDKFNINNVIDLKTDVFQSKEWVEFYQSIDTNPCSICITSCSNHWIREVTKTYKPDGSVIIVERN